MPTNITVVPPPPPAVVHVLLGLERAVRRPVASKKQAKNVNGTVITTKTAVSLEESVMASSHCPSRGPSVQMALRVQSRKSFGRDRVANAYPASVGAILCIVIL